MRKIIYSLMVSLDGFIARPDGSLDWVAIDEELHRFVNDQERELGGFLYGRRTWEVMAGFWPAADADPSAQDFIVDYARIWKNTPKIVFSKTLEHVEGNATLLHEVIPEEIVNLKEQPGGDLAVGGADLAATFMRLGLIDEYRLFVSPVILGCGVPLFPSLDKQIDLRLVETRAFGSGVIYLRYEVFNKQADN